MLYRGHVFLSLGLMHILIVMHTIGCIRAHTVLLGSHTLLIFSGNICQGLYALVLMPHTLQWLCIGDHTVLQLVITGSFAVGTAQHRWMTPSPNVIAFLYKSVRLLKGPWHFPCEKYVLVIQTLIWVLRTNGIILHWQ